MLQGWSASFTTGVAMKLKDGGQISAGGELGGIGSNTNTTVWTFKVSGSAPFCQRRASAHNAVPHNCGLIVADGSFAA
jgi:hypothetical protein